MHFHFYKDDVVDFGDKKYVAKTETRHYTMNALPGKLHVKSGDIVIDIRPVLKFLRYIRPAKWLTYFGCGLLCLWEAMQVAVDGHWIDCGIGFAIGVACLFYSLYCIADCKDWGQS